MILFQLKQQGKYDKKKEECIWHFAVIVVTSSQKA